jgi:protein-arginine kinase activator protein McsA
LIVVISRVLSRDRTACSQCGQTFSSRRATQTVGGLPVCSRCATNKAWETLDHVVADLPGAAGLAVRALRPKDPEVGQKCPSCGMTFKIADPVSTSSAVVRHLACAQLLSAFE